MARSVARVWFNSKKNTRCDLLCLIRGYRSLIFSRVVCVEIRNQLFAQKHSSYGVCTRSTGLVQRARLTGSDLLTG